MNELTAAQRVSRRLQWQRSRFIVSQPDFYNTRQEYWRHVGRGYRRFWIDLHRGRPWLETLLAVLGLIVVLSVLGYLIYLGYVNRRVSETTTSSGNDLSARALRFIIAAIMLCIPINYWFFRFLQYPQVKRVGRTVRNQTHSARLVWRLKSKDLGLVVLKRCFGVVTAIATVWVLFFSMWNAIGVVLSTVLLWVSGRIVFRVGDLVFTAWNQYSPDTQISQSRYWAARWVVLLNLFVLLALPSVANALPDHSWFPVTGWLMGAIVEVCNGNRQVAFILLVGLFLAIGGDYVLKKSQQSVAWKRRYLTKTKIHRGNDLSFQRALEVANEEKVKEQQLSAGGLAVDLARIAQRGYVKRYFARLENLYIACLGAASLVSAALMFLMYQMIEGVPVEETADLHQRIGLMWCVPMFVCICLVQVCSSNFLRVRGFGKSPVSLLRWWKLHFANSGLMLATYWLVCLPSVATIGCLFGVDYPWLLLGTVIGYLSLLAVSLSMIAASLLALVHLWCLMPAWVRWFEGDLGVLVLILIFFTTLFSGTFLAQEFGTSISGSMIAAMMAAPPILALATMAYTYVFTETLGEDSFPVKK